MSIKRQVAKINLKKDLSDDKYNGKNLNYNSDSDITKMTESEILNDNSDSVIPKFYSNSNLAEATIPVQ